MKIPNLTCRQSRNVSPSLSNRNSVIRPFTIMTNYELVVLLTYNQYEKYPEKLSENVPLRGAQKRKNFTTKTVTYHLYK